MSFIRTQSPADAEDAVLEMYQRQEDHWGYVPNYAKVFSHRPEVLARWAKLLSEMRRPMDVRRFELVTFAVAHELKHSACALAHGRELARIIGEDYVLRIARGREAEVLPAAEVAMVRYARCIARDASSIGAKQVTELKERHGLTDAEIFDIAAIAAGRSYFTKLLDALGCEPDIAYMSLEENFRRTLTVGRPICQTPLEYLASNNID